MTCTLQEAQRVACAEVGIAYRDVPWDGRWHVTNVEGDPRGRGDGRTKVFPGGIGWDWKGDKPGFHCCTEYVAWPKRVYAGGIGSAARMGNCKAGSSDYGFWHRPGKPKRMGV
jgi:hypothetical protein